MLDRAALGSMILSSGQMNGLENWLHCDIGAAVGVYTSFVPQAGSLSVLPDL